MASLQKGWTVEGCWRRLVGMKFVLVVMFSFYFAGCFAGADYENKQIYVYGITGPKVLQQFKADSSNKENSSPRTTENTDEILFRIIDTEIKRAGQLVYASLFSPTIHAEADNSKTFQNFAFAVPQRFFGMGPVVDRCRF